MRGNNRHAPLLELERDGHCALPWLCVETITAENREKPAIHKEAGNFAHTLLYPL